LSKKGVCIKTISAEIWIKEVCKSLPRLRRRLTGGWKALRGEIWFGKEHGEEACLDQRLYKIPIFDDDESENTGRGRGRRL